MNGKEFVWNLFIYFIRTPTKSLKNNYEMPVTILVFNVWMLRVEKEQYRCLHELFAPSVIESKVCIDENVRVVCTF